MRNPDFDGRRPRGASSSRPADPAPEDRPKRQTPKPPAGPPRIFHPLTLREWLGDGALHPPEGILHAPSFDGLKAYPAPAPALLEALGTPEDEPEYAAWLEKDAGGGKEPHWHATRKGERYYHADRDWGRPRQDGWAWMREYYQRWWTVADGAQRMVRHQDHWWWKERGVWFLLHEGQPWAWRYFADWEREGLIHPATGTKMVYSADGSHVAVETPGLGTRVFDAHSGAELAVYLDSHE